MDRQWIGVSRLDMGDLRRFMCVDHHPDMPIPANPSPLVPLYVPKGYSGMGIDL